MATTKPVPTRTKPARTGTLVLEGAGAKAAASLAVAIAPEVLKALSPRKATVKAVVESLGAAFARTQRSGRAGGFTVTIDADGQPQIAPLPNDDETAAAPSEGSARDRAFADARARGRIVAADILSRDDMLSADQMADRLGISRVTVNARRQRHELLGLDGAKRGFRFPDWQVDDDGKPIDVMPQLFELLGPSPWGVYRFLTQRHDALGGQTAMDALQRAGAKPVLDAAESLGRGDFA